MDNPLKPLAEAAIEAVAKNASKAKDALTTESSKRHNAEKKALSDANIAKTQTASQMLTDKMKEIDVPEEFAKHALYAELETIVNKRSLLDKIWEKTKVLLQKTPKDDPNIGEISDDWLNRFRESACQKSSEEAQELFSKVLAGEIRKPGSISLLALTTLADMDQEVAQLFNTFCSLCIVHLIDPDEFLARDFLIIDDIRLPILRGRLKDTETQKDTNSKIREFTEFSKSIYTKYNLNENTIQLLLDHRLIVDDTSIKYLHIWYNNELWGFMSPDGQRSLLVNSNIDITISGLALTSVGKELFHITEHNPPIGYWDLIYLFLQNYYDVNLNKLSKPQKKSRSDPSTDQITSET